MTIAKMSAVALGCMLVLSACAKSSDQTNATATAAAAAGTTAVNVGGKVYQTNCSSCHQTNGQGVPGTFPPLAGNAVVVGDPAKVIHIVKYGLTGSITVGGKSYGGVMPAWGPTLSNDDIAQAVTYIRSSWGNKASAVTEADVAGAKQ